jgi:Cu2+-exporting ATPase
MAEANNQRACLHCGVPLRPAEPTDYCCRGCEYVAKLIAAEGLDEYYNLRDNVVEPVSPATLRAVDYSWLAEKVATEQSSGQAQNAKYRLLLDLRGISCVGCVWLIERIFDRSGITGELRIHPQRGQLELLWCAGSDAIVPFFETIHRFGYNVAPAGKVVEETNHLAPLIGLNAAFALNTMLFTLPVYLGMDADFAFADLFGMLSLVFASLAYLSGGLWFVKKAWNGLRQKILALDTPIALGVSAAYLGSLLGFGLDMEDFLYFDFVAIFIFLMLCGRWVHERALERNRNRIRAGQWQLERYRSLDGNQIVASEIVPETEIFIDPGQIVPVAIELREAASISLESINGESEPRSFAAGARISSGCFPGGSKALRAVTRERWSEGLLFELLQAKPDAKRNQSMEKVLEYYILAVVIIAISAWLGWGVFAQEWTQAAQVLLSILVVSCPCALGVAYPLINDLAASLLRKKGVYPREASLWGRIGKIDTVIFDKTGTLTLETLDFTNESILDTLTPEQLSALRQLVESSFHPVSRTIRECLVSRGVKLDGERIPTAEIPGSGVQMSYQAKLWRLGRREAKHSSTNDGTTEFSCAGETLADFAFRDRVRDGAKAEMDWWRQAGYRVALLSGDNRDRVCALADELELDPSDVLHEQSPEAKRNWIRREAPDSALMIGDGLNDSLAFETALCRGTPLLDRGVLEDRSDFFFTGNGLAGPRWLLAVFKRRRLALFAVFIFAIGYNLSAISVCLLGWMTPLLAAILMPISSVITIAIAGWFLHAKSVANLP